MGVRVVVRNSSGYVQATLAKVVPYIVDPTLAETGGLAAVQFCCVLGLQRVVLEGDSLTMIFTLRREGSCWSGYGQLIEDI
jgi:hypothetical protein